MATKGMRAYRAEQNAAKGAIQAEDLDKAVKEHADWQKAKTFAAKSKHKSEALRIIRDGKLCSSTVKEIASKATAIRNELSR